MEVSINFASYYIATYVIFSSRFLIDLYISGMYKNESNFRVSLYINLKTHKMLLWPVVRNAIELR